MEINTIVYSINALNNVNTLCLEKIQLIICLNSSIKDKQLTYQTYPFKFIDHFFITRLSFRKRKTIKLFNNEI